MTLVVDASVVAKWFFDEDRDAATTLRACDDLIAPAILRVELLGVVTKRHGRGEIDDATGEAILALVPSMPIRFVSGESLLEPAFVTSIGVRIGFRDALYVACAQHFDAPLFSGDDRLLRALASRPLGLRSCGLPEIGTLPEERSSI